MLPDVARDKRYLAEVIPAPDTAQRARDELVVAGGMRAVQRMHVALEGFTRRRHESSRGSVSAKRCGESG
jgi:hypothetical protein